jgi:hypothetical protein
MDFTSEIMPIAPDGETSSGAIVTTRIGRAQPERVSPQCAYELPQGAVGLQPPVAFGRALCWREKP